jgi:hypothetical protein
MRGLPRFSGSTELADSGSRTKSRLAAFHNGVQKLHELKHDAALMEAPQSTDGADVDAGRAEPAGRRFVPPGKRPSTGVAARKGRERPRPCAVHAAPEPTGGVAHAPMSMSDLLGARVSCAPECRPRIRTDVSANFPSGTASLLPRFPQVLRPTFRSVRLLVCSRSGSRLSGSA